MVYSGHVECKHFSERFWGSDKTKLLDWTKAQLGFSMPLFLPSCLIVVVAVCLQQLGFCFVIVLPRIYKSKWAYLQILNISIQGTDKMKTAVTIDLEKTTLLPTNNPDKWQWMALLILGLSVNILAPWNPLEKLLYSK